MRARKAFVIGSLVLCGCASSPATGPSGSGRGPGRDGGAHDPSSAGPELCADPGATRPCCETGTQTCSSGTEFSSWGPCRDGSGAVLECGDGGWDPAPPAGCLPDEFGRPVCDGGASTPPTPPPGCLPDEFGGYTCDGGVTAPPPSGCVPGGVCRPGAERWCDTSLAEWSRSICDSTGHWGPCMAATAPSAVSDHGCGPDDFAPERCCPPLHMCCQDNPDGPFIGDCTAGECP